MKFSAFLERRTIFDNGFRSLVPRISIVMPTFCRMAEGLLEKCIESVLAQSFADFEFIIVDDGSVDGSEQLILEHAKRDNRIVYVRHDVNSGLPAVRTNEGILLARAPYVAFIFDDNVWKEDALAVLIREIEANDADMVYANTEMVQKDGSDPICYGRWPLSLAILQYLNTIPNGSVLCRRSFFEQFGLYDPHIALRRICDWDLWLRALALGAKIHHIDEVVDVEFGTASPVSLGSSVKWDYKASFAYMTDSRRRTARTASLHPSSIMEYDVFDIEKILPYVRSLQEWDYFESIVYTPFFSSHPYYQYEPLVQHNRRYDSALHGYSLTASHALFPERLRILFVSNCWSLTIEDWMTSLSVGMNAIAIHCGEISLSAFAPQDIDLLLLFDCTAVFITEQLAAFKELGVPIAYIVEHGIDIPVSAACDPLHAINFAQSERISSLLGQKLYFPQSGYPWTEEMHNDAQRLMKFCNIVYRISHKEALPSDFGRLTMLEFIQNNAPCVQFMPDNVAIYMGDPTRISQDAQDAVKSLLQNNMLKKCSIYLHDGLNYASSLSEHEQSFTISYCRDALDLACYTLEHTALIVPDEILLRYSNYILMQLQEYLLAKGSFLLRLSQIAGSDDIWIRLHEILDATVLQEHEKCRRMHDFNHRTLHHCSIARALLVSSLQPYDKCRVAVFLNSPLLAGSEVYGLMLVMAMRSVGLDAQACIPSMHGYGTAADAKDIQAWLADRKLPEAVIVPYGHQTWCFAMEENDFEMAADQVRQWLLRERIGVVICSGLMPEVVWAAQGNAIPYTALFQPFSYPSEQMAFLRECSAGFMSDCDWSTSYWRRFLPPPANTVRSMIEDRYFLAANINLASHPIHIAVGGTLQPRKRQKEAILAISSLCEKGYNLILNIYGYELEMMEDYTSELKEIAGRTLGTRASFRGLVDISTIAEENHIFLMPSIDESMPQTLLFMMAAGLIAVCCPAGGIGEVIRDEETGIMADGFAVADISHALERALQLQSDWKNISENARRLLAREHSPEVVTYQLFRILYAGALIERSPGRNFPGISYQKGRNRDAAIGLRRFSRRMKSRIVIHLKKMLTNPSIRRVYIRYRHVEHVQRILNYLRS